MRDGAKDCPEAVRRKGGPGLTAGWGSWHRWRAANVPICPHRASELGADSHRSVTQALPACEAAGRASTELLGWSSGGGQRLQTSELIGYVMMGLLDGYIVTTTWYQSKVDPQS